MLSGGKFKTDNNKNTLIIKLKTIMDKDKTIPTLSQTSGSGSVYLAFMRIDYEGIYESSMKLFKKKKDAEKHLVELKELHGAWSKTYEVVELHCH